MLNLLKHELRSRLGAIIGWSIGLAFFGLLYLGIYPEVGEQMQSLADISIYQAMGVDVSSFEGYAASTVIMFLPILLGIYAIITSTDALAGEEDSGVLELILAMPLPRWQIVTVKAIAMEIATLIILLVAAVADVLIFNAIKDSVTTSVTAGDLFIGVLAGWPLILAVLMIGLFCGAYLPTRRIAALTTTVVFVASYFIKILTGFVDSFDWLEPLSLFHYYDTSARLLMEGPDLGDILVLVAVAVLFFALAIIAFQRRDVTVHAWPWQRARQPA